MEIELVIEKALIPAVPAPKAYQIVFADTGVYCIFLSRDVKGFSGGYKGRGIEGAAAAGILNLWAGKTDKKVAEALEKIKNANLDEVVANDKKSAFFTYDSIKSVKYKPKSIMSGEAFFQFKTKKAGNFKFRLFEDEHIRVIKEYLEKKRPDLF